MPRLFQIETSSVGFNGDSEAISVPAEYYRTCVQISTINPDSEDIMSSTIFYIEDRETYHSAGVKITMSEKDFTFWRKAMGFILGELSEREMR